MPIVQKSEFHTNIDDSDAAQLTSKTQESTWWVQYDSMASSWANSSSPEALPFIIVLTLFSLKQLGHRRMNWRLVITA